MANAITPKTNRSIFVGVNVLDAQGQVMRTEIMEIGIYFETNVTQVNLDEAQVTAQEYARQNILPNILNFLGGENLGTPVGTIETRFVEQGPAAPAVPAPTYPAAAPDANQGANDPDDSNPALPSLSVPDISAAFDMLNSR